MMRNTFRVMLRIAAGGIFKPVAALVLALMLAGCTVPFGAAPRIAPTATPSPDIPQPTPTARPQFSDSLTSDSGVWTPVFGGANTCAFKDGGLELSTDICVVQFMDVSSGAIGMDTRFITGILNTGYGLEWDVTDNRGYEFLITGNGGWALVAFVVGAQTHTLDSGQSQAINQGTGATNTLRVTFQSSQITLYANHAPLGQDTSSMYSDGIIGVATFHGATVVFNNFAYWQ